MLKRSCLRRATAVRARLHANVRVRLLSTLAPQQPWSGFTVGLTRPSCSPGTSGPVTESLAQPGLYMRACRICSFTSTKPNETLSSSSFHTNHNENGNCDCCAGVILTSLVGSKHRRVGEINTGGGGDKHRRVGEIASEVATKTTYFAHRWFVCE